MNADQTRPQVPALAREFADHPDAIRIGVQALSWERLPASATAIIGAPAAPSS